MVLKTLLKIKEIKKKLFFCILFLKESLEPQLQSSSLGEKDFLLIYKATGSIPIWVIVAPNSLMKPM